MDPRFTQLANRLHPAFLKLVAQPAVADGVTPDNTTARSISNKGVYLFTEAGTHLYVGRSNHCLSEWYENQQKLLFELADEEARIKRATSKSGSSELVGFAEAWDGAMAQAETRIRAMEYRWVEEADPTCQCLLQIYVSVALATKYNKFEIH